MITRTLEPCASHQATLIDLVDGGGQTGATGAALDHLDRCRVCETQLTDIALAIAALRRMGRDLAAVEPPPDAWPGLRERLARRSRRSAILSPLAGMAFGIAVVASSVLPRWISTEPLVGPAFDPVAVERVAEQAFIRNRRPIVPVADLRGLVPRPDPDAVRPAEKEVAEGPSGRAPAAI
jgi:anti-sigma factor RsiW